MPQAISRRFFVQGLAAASSLGINAADAAPAAQLEAVGRLIHEARAKHPRMVQRIEFISQALLGTRYQENTLIGGPRRPEQLVIRIDAFDCVTYCEVVLAAATAGDVQEFDKILRRIRYQSGEVRWQERNHYFAEWCRANIENKTCRLIALPDTVTIRKTVEIGNLGRRQVSMVAVSSDSLMAKAAPLLVSGDIIGFVSRRANLDVFHTGLVIVGGAGSLTLRHASKSRRRVVDEPLQGFLTTNRVQHVMLLRAVDRPTYAGLD